MSMNEQAAKEMAMQNQLSQQLGCQVQKQTLRDVLDRRQQDARRQIENAQTLLEMVPAAMLDMDVYEFYRLIGC